MTEPIRLPLVGPRRKEALQALSADPLDEYPAFVDAVSQRLEKGREAYGDTSFDKPIGELLGELEQECLDLAGWGFALWSRLQRVKARAVSLHETAKSPLNDREPAECYSPSDSTVSGRNNSSGAVTRGKKRMLETDRHPSTFDNGEPENLKSLRDSQFILHNSAKGGDNGSDKGGAGRPDKTLLYAHAREGGPNAR